MNKYTLEITNGILEVTPEKINYQDLTIHEETEKSRIQFPNISEGKFTRGMILGFSCTKYNLASVYLQGIDISLSSVTEQ